jgi:hypothetical protein
MNKRSAEYLRHHVTVTMQLVVWNKTNVWNKTDIVSHLESCVNPLLFLVMILIILWLYKQNTALKARLLSAEDTLKVAKVTLKARLLSAEDTLKVTLANVDRQNRIRSFR